MIRSSHPTPRSLRSLAVIGAGLAVTAAAIALPAPAANAAEVDGAIQDVRVTPVRPVVGAQLTTDIDWCVPNDAVAGDTFWVQLSDHLRSLPGDFRLDDPDTGAPVADAVISDAAPWTITFTLTDYVATHDDVCGTAFVVSDYDGLAVPSGQTTDFDSVANDGRTFTTPVAPVGAVLGDQTAPSKYGAWTRPDHGEADPVDALTWNVDTPVGPFASARTVDTLPAGQQWDCGQLTLQDGYVDPAGDFVVTADVTPHPPVPGAVPTYSCDATTIDVTWPAQPDQGTAPQHRFRLAATASLTAATGAGSALEFDNAADVTTTAVGGQPVTRTASAVIRQPSDGGQGQGQTPVAAAAPAAGTAPVAPAPAAAASTGGEELALTGTDDTAGIALGVALVLAGLAAGVLGRRRRPVRPRHRG